MGHPSFEEKWNKYNVIKLDWNFEYGSTGNGEDIINWASGMIIVFFGRLFQSRCMIFASS
ncbi:MAG: hypothetical protein K5989_12510 [Lachnospiraceae bacterium]|nr:hypothetical protein [Lachnospiraceae bacterium]